MFGLKKLQNTNLILEKTDRKSEKPAKPEEKPKKPRGNRLNTRKTGRNVQSSLNGPAQREPPCAVRPIPPAISGE
jgi:hypothetical protein